MSPHDLDHAESYAAYAEIAEALDAASGAAAWRDDDRSPHYDEAAIRDSGLAMKRLRAEGDAVGLAQLLTEDLYRHLNDLLTPDLYRMALAGTKRFIDRYLEESETALRWLATAPGVPASLVLERFETAWHVFGRSALLLSGGATWGFHHFGVCKALFELGLLPDILSGASTGAMIAAGMGARNDDEVADLFANLDQLRLDGLAPVGWRHAARQGAWLDASHLEEVLRHNIGEYTFAEAYARSGRVLAVSVSPTRHRQKARLLSYLTAPEVVLPSAVMASSALPGLFPPVVLKRRLPDGTETDYQPGERWVDGSIAGDLPKRRLARLHNVNHTIVSQTNPHVVPFVGSQSRRGVVPTAMRLAASTAQSQGAWALDLVRQMSGGQSRALGRMAAAGQAMFRQEYTGHVDVVPKFRWGLLRRMMSNPTRDDLDAFVRSGARSVWREVPQIRAQTRIGRAFRACVKALRQAVREDPRGPGAAPPMPT